MRKHKKFYRPKDEKKYTAENGQHVFKKYVSQFMDCIDFGVQKGKRKSHRLINTYLSRNNPRSTNNISLRVTKPKKYNYKVPHTQYIGSIEEHLKGDYFLYYQCRPDSFIHLINDDFDSIKNPSDTLTDDIYQTIVFRKSDFPDSYFDLGSSGLSLNHFKLVSSESLFDYFMFEYEDECRFPRFINKILNSMSRIYRCIYNTNSPYSLPPNLKFDSIKGTLSDYERYQSRKNGKIYYKRIIHSGQFAKLPRPTSIEQYRTFYTMKIYDILYLMEVAITRYIISLYSYSVDTLVNILSVGSSSFSRIHYNACKAALYLCEILEKVKQDSLYNDYKVYLGSLFTPPLTKEEKKEENQSLSLLPFSLSISPTSMTTVFTARAKEEKKEHLKIGTENKNRTEQKTLDLLLDDAKNEPDAIIRSKYYARYLFRKYWDEKNRIPTFEEYRINYRTDVGTGLEDEDDVKRLEYIYNAYVREFNPQKIHKSKYVAGEYITRLEKILSQEQINEFVRENTCYKYQITYEDLDLVAGCFYLSLSGKLEQKEWCNKELTVPFRSVIDFFKYMKAQGQSKRSCNNGKCKALIELLKHIDWVNCVDTSYSTRTHRARRYILTQKHPKYKAFEKAVGKEVIDRYRTQQSSVQIVPMSA